MDNLDDILMVMEESQEISRRLEVLRQRIGRTGSPELSGFGGTVTMFMSPAGGAAPSVEGAPPGGEGSAAG
ncbi:MAG: hypothetical protein ACTHN5_22040 [Phycisphaerae bacterium]